jgi:SAM-dependent methyltransferase
MSSYEDYNHTSQAYDASRVPVGVTHALQTLGRAGPLNTLQILDTGCGTGQFITVLRGVGAKVTGVDLNEGMLAVAQRKFAGDADVHLHQARIQNLPFDRASFDGVVINQVLHHLPDPDWSLHREVLAELRRVLRPGGSLVINTCSQPQLREGFWYFALMPERPLADMCARYCTVPKLWELLREVGFDDVARHAVVDEPIFGARLLESEGPLDPAWRNGDSSWALLSPDELERSLQSTRKMKQAGTLDSFMRKNDLARQRLGQVTLVTAR